MPWSHPPLLKVGEQGPNSYLSQMFPYIIIRKFIRKPKKKIEDEIITQEES